jgi:hypothetical protein
MSREPAGTAVAWIAVAGAVGFAVSAATSW